MSGSIFKGQPWEFVAESKARKIAKDRGQPEELWELFLMEANQQMLREIKDDKRHGISCNCSKCRWTDKEI